MSNQQPAPAPTPAQPDPMVVLQLPLSQVNAALHHLAQGKLVETFDAFSNIRTQAMNYVQALNAQAAEAAAAAPAAAAPAADAPAAGSDAGQA